MTKDGYKSVIVSQDTYDKLKEIAKVKDVSLCKALSEVIAEYIGEVKGVALPPR